MSNEYEYDYDTLELSGCVVLLGEDVAFICLLRASVKTRNSDMARWMNYQIRVRV